MSLTFKNGDMFAENVEAVVNTVNCVGVMGKGVALEFKKRWPDNYKAYKKLCDQNLVRPGEMFVFENTSMLESQSPRFLVNFPTKKHWRGKSHIEYVEDGLTDLVRQIIHYRMKSVALPPLGCGNGGLDWNDVKPLIKEKLSTLSDVEIVVFEPKEAVSSAEFEGNPDSRKMTIERAVLVKAFAEFEPYFGGHLTRLTAQKLTYFLQALGVDFKLEFSRNLYGPYSESLRKALLVMDSQGFIQGFTSDERLITVPAGAYSQAEEFLEANDHEGADNLINTLGLLIQGFESPFGMELLSTVHYLATKEECKPVEKVIAAISEWSERKGTIFSEDSIRSAYSRLVLDGLVKH